MSLNSRAINRRMKRGPRISPRLCPILFIQHGKAFTGGPENQLQTRHRDVRSSFRILIDFRQPVPLGNKAPGHRAPLVTRCHWRLCFRKQVPQDCTWAEACQPAGLLFMTELLLQVVSFVLKPQIHTRWICEGRNCLKTIRPSSLTRQRAEGVAGETGGVFPSCCSASRFSRGEPGDARSSFHVWFSLADTTPSLISMQEFPFH